MHMKTNSPDREESRSTTLTNQPMLIYLQCTHSLHIHVYHASEYASKRLDREAGTAAAAAAAAKASDQMGSKASYSWVKREGGSGSGRGAMTRRAHYAWATRSDVSANAGLENGAAAAG